MRASVLRTFLLCNAALLLAGASADAQPRARPFPGTRPASPAAPAAGSVAAPAPANADAPPPATPPPGAAPPPAFPGAAPGAVPGGAPVIGPNGKAVPDTNGLAQFESGIEYTPKNGGDKVSFSLEDADLPELVRVIGELTGKRFIFGGKVHNIKATVFSPQKVTVAEA
ncbi:MAG TPA: type II secretion system protein GspD, partial [Polyangiaceae bacterium]